MESRRISKVFGGYQKKKYKNRIQVLDEFRLPVQIHETHWTYIPKLAKGCFAALGMIRRVLYGQTRSSRLEALRADHLPLSSIPNNLPQSEKSQRVSDLIMSNLMFANFLMPTTSLCPLAHLWTIKQYDASRIICAFADFAVTTR